MTSVNLNEFLLDAYRRQKQGDFKAAETMYRHALSQHPDHPDVLNLLATLAIDLRKPEPALPLLERAIALHPSPPGYHINLSHVLRMLRRRDEAVVVARRAAAVAPDETAGASPLAPGPVGKREIGEGPGGKPEGGRRRWRPTNRRRIPRCRWRWWKRANSRRRWRRISRPFDWIQTGSRRRFRSQACT